MFMGMCALGVAVVGDTTCDEETLEEEAVEKRSSKREVLYFTWTHLPLKVISVVHIVYLP